MREEKNFFHFFLSSPESSIPKACQDIASTKAAYRFFSNKRIKPDLIMEAHQLKILEKVSDSKVVLKIQDTTELNYNSQKSIKGLGYLDNSKCIGLKVHSTLVVSEVGLIISQKVWSRDKVGTKHTRHEKPIEEKESYKWLESLKETESMFSDKLQIMIADRESDIYDLFTMPRRKNSHFLIRASQNRLLKDIDKKLFTALEKADAKGNLVIEVGRKKGQDSRLANLTVKYERLSIKAPKNTPKEIKDVSLNAILVEEREFSDGIEPIKWILLTTLEIASLEDALKYVRWYSYRWLIERFHFVLKSGCQIEKLQLGSSEQIQKALAMYSIMSSIILFITYKARIEPDSSAEEIFTKKELKVLYLLTHKKEYTSKNTITFKDSILYIAKLGGFLARKSDGNPGLKTIWLGYRKFYDIIQGVNLIKHFKYINT